ncbi:MAG: hypothetical protein ACREC5_04200 [Thermoplasmata archaeon]
MNVIGPSPTDDPDPDSALRAGNEKLATEGPPPPDMPMVDENDPGIGITARRRIPTAMSITAKATFRRR